MGYNFVQQSTDNSTTSKVNTASASSITTTAHNLLIVIVETRDVPAVPANMSITDGSVGNTYTYVGMVTQAQQYTLTVAPSGTSGTLSSTFGQNSGSWPIQFSDGSQRTCTVANGSTAITWTPTLAAGPSTTVNILSYGFSSLIYIAQNINGGATVVTATDNTDNNILGVTVQEYSGLLTSGALIGSSYSSILATGSAGANLFALPNITNTVPAMLWGYSFQGNQPNSTSAQQTAGTSPLAFTGRTMFFAGTNGNAIAVALTEDIAVTGNAGVTFGITAAGDSNAYMGFQMMLGISTAAPALGASQFNTQASGSSLASGTGINTTAAGSTFLCAFVSDHQYSSGDLSVTDNKGNSWPLTPVAQVYLANATNSWLKVFVMQNGVGGSGHIATAHDTGATYLQTCELVEITNNGNPGVFPVLDISAVNSLYASSGTVNCSVITAHANEFVYACDKNDQGSTSSSLTLNGGFTGITNSSGNSYNEYASGYLIAPAFTTTANPAWTSTYGVDNGAITLGFYLSIIVPFLPYQSTQFFSTDRVVQF